jgi:spore cortex formation protein SpoVR/YcgB (stage V sporulation)
MPVSYSELSGLYVVLWSPRLQIYRNATVSEMLLQNWVFFHRQQRQTEDWLVVGFARTERGASNMQTQLGHQLSTRNQPPPDDYDIDDPPPTPSWFRDE